MTDNEYRVVGLVVAFEFQDNRLKALNEIIVGLSTVVPIVELL
jgi:hypothetical protein